MEQTSVEWIEGEVKKSLIPAQKDFFKWVFEEAKEMQKRDNALFLRWFTKHYTTTNDGQSFGWANSMGEEVTIEQIIEHYYSQEN